VNPNGDATTPSADVAPRRTLRLVLAYHGGAFHGWQTQPGYRTVQEEIERVAQRVLREPLSVVGASRTDAGVHAVGQSAHVHTNSTLPLEKLRRAIGDRLPEDIALVHLAETKHGFHAIRDAVGKLYRYRIHAAAHAPPAAAAHGVAWHVWHVLDVDRMRDAAARLVGTHDFAGLAASGSVRATTIRTIRRCEIASRFEELRIDVEGDGFLYNQVRNIVGTLVEIGRGHWPAERIDEILLARDRALAGPTAPPQGLTLQWVRYPAAALAPTG
jgi:tRNA pseudouridine38-40 synthase